MEMTTFKTLINKDHKLANNDYVLGRIFGIAEIICDLFGGMVERVDKDGNVHNVATYRGHYRRKPNKAIEYLLIECSQEQYEQFKERVEIHYPDLLTFYWEG